MAEYTENLNLIKPAQDEQYNVDDFNDNFDKIDDFAGIVPPRALTADKLTTGAKINGVNFKGDTDIITGLGLYSDTNTYNNTNLVYLYDNSKLKIFQSSQNGNIGHNPLTSPTYWNEIQIGSKRHFGEYVTSSLPLTDATLHLADGSLLSQTDYPELFSFISSIYQAPVSTLYYAWKNGSTIYYTLSNSPSINNTVYTYSNTQLNMVDSGTIESVWSLGSIKYIIVNGYSYEKDDTNNKTVVTSTIGCFTTEADWQEKFTAFGECGKYVYNASANTLRIPLLSSYFSNTSSVSNLGTLTPASLPNIKGEGILQDDVSKCSGIIYDIESVSTNNSEPGGSSSHLMGIDANRVSDVYSDTATTVNTQSIKQLVYIVVKA